MELETLQNRLARRARRQQWLSEQVVFGPSSAHYRWTVWAWTIAVFARLSLAESWQPSWSVAGGLLVVGTAGLLRYGGRLWWGLCWLGLFIPLFFLRDWLTQSVVLLLIASVGVLTVHKSDQRQRHSVGEVARWLVAATYAIAAFHKTNSGFFDPTISCTSYTWAEFNVFFEAVRIPNPQFLLDHLPLAVVVFEFGLAALLFVHHRVAILLGLIFHLPLTLVLAPSFFFVMGIGYVGCLTDRDRELLIKIGRRWFLPSALFGLVSTVLLGLLSRHWWPPDLLLKEYVFFQSIAVVSLLLFETRATRARRLVLLERKQIVLSIGVVAVFGFNALLPYSGLQFQHSGAMLSNLRIDDGCWNHYLVPESVRLVDPYVRIADARVSGVGEGGGELEELLEGRLWSPLALRSMQWNWCTAEALHVGLEGTHLGTPFVTDDLCGEGVGLPQSRGLLGGATWFPNYLRFQKGLGRHCIQECIH